MNTFRALLIGSLIAALVACHSQDATPLPILGIHEVDPVTGDTIYHSIPDFTFTDQDSAAISPATFEGKAYIADFFFTSCPTICPKVAKQMLRIYDRYQHEDRLKMLSFTIDPKHDDVPRLKHYADGLGVSADRWHFVTGEKDSIYNLAGDYMSIAKEDPNAPGGFDHSGWILLVDKNHHIRAYCNGTKEEEVDKFMGDIDRLMAEP